MIACSCVLLSLSSPGKIDVRDSACMYSKFSPLRTRKVQYNMLLPSSSLSKGTSGCKIACSCI